MCIISVREVLNFEFKDCPFFAAMKNSDDSLLCFSLGWGILNIRQDICQLFFNQIAFTVGLCVLWMYALFDAHEKSQCSFSVSQVLCTNWLFLLSYPWLVTRVKFSSRRWGRDSPYKAPLYDRFHWTWKYFTPKIRQSKNSDSAVSRIKNSNWDVGLIWICTEKFEFLDLVDCGGEAFSVESVIWVFATLYMTDSTENTSPPKSTKSSDSDSRYLAVQTQIEILV